MIRIVLAVLAVVSFFVGIVTFMGARSELGEIQAFLLLLIAAVFFVGAAIVDSISQLKR